MSLVSVAISRASNGGFDKMVAGLAAAAAAVAVFILPTDLLNQLVVASGMPDVLAPLQPPLGLRAKLGLALLCAGSAFGMVLLLMKLLGRLPAKKREEAEPEMPVAPRVRRRDRHPDAPARAPLSVSRDLGEPEPTPDMEPEPELAPFPRARIRTPDTRRRAPLIEVLGGVKADPEEAREVVAEEPRPVEPPREAETAEAPVVQEAEPEQVEVAAKVAAPEAEPVAFQQPEPEPEPEPILAKEPEQAPSTVWTGQETLTELLARLERALERKEAFRDAEAPAAAAFHAHGPGEGTEVRLRSALENLRRFAPRHG